LYVELKIEMKATETIPELLIYESIRGIPFYYKGYKAYLNKELQLEEIMGSSKLWVFKIENL